VLNDLRHAVRLLIRAKGWTVVVIVSLALGIGANTALFSAVNGLLLRTVPVRDADSLVRLRWVGKNDMVTDSSDYGFVEKDPAGRQVRTTFSYPMYQQFLADNRTMEDLLACAPYGRVNVVVDGRAEIATAFIASGNYYRLLGVGAWLGRTIVPDDDRPDAPAVAVISSTYWRSRFGSDPAVVGRTVRVADVLVTVIGVLPPAFTGIQQAIANAPDITFPLALDDQLTSGRPAAPGEPPPAPRLRQPTTWWLQVMGRLKAEVTPPQVQANLGAVFQQTARAGLASYLVSLSEAARSTATNRSRTEVPELLVQPGGRGVYDANTNAVRSVTILSVVVALVLLIVCANVANLLLSRATTRQKEISVRISLGATRAPLVRQLLTESVLLASIGGAVGMLVGYWGQLLLPGAPGQQTPFDWRVFAFVGGITVLAGVLFGAAPALRGTGINVSAALKETSRSLAGSRSLLGKALLVVQVAISLVLLVGAGLFLRTLQNLRHVDVGFNPERLVLFRLNPSLNRYDDKATIALYGRLVERLQAVPGVRAVSFSNVALLSGSVNSTSIFVQGRTYAPKQFNGINRIVASPSFFDTVGIPLVAGRGFTARDDAGAPKVVVINEAAAVKYFPNENPIGRHFGSSVETAGQLEIIGMLRDAKYDSVREPAPPTMYVPYTQARIAMAVFEVRTAAEPIAATGAIREAVRQIDPNLPVMDMSTQADQIEQRFAQEKVFARAYSLFGALALLLASVGLFGLMSYSVARRTNEIGVRMALGAQRGDVLRLVMRESMVLVVAGIAIGLAVAVAASRLVTTLLYGLAPTDPATLAGAMAVMLGVSAVAGYVPARRASRVDPMVALHYE